MKSPSVSERKSEEKFNLNNIPLTSWSVLSTTILSRVLCNKRSLECREMLLFSLCSKNRGGTEERAVRGRKRKGNEGKRGGWQQGNMMNARMCIANTNINVFLCKCKRTNTYIGVSVTIVNNRFSLFLLLLLLSLSYYHVHIRTGSGIWIVCVSTFYIGM